MINRKPITIIQGLTGLAAAGIIVRGVVYVETFKWGDTVRYYLTDIVNADLPAYFLVARNPSYYATHLIVGTQDIYTVWRGEWVYDYELALNRPRHQRKIPLIPIEARWCNMCVPAQSGGVMYDSEERLIRNAIKKFCKEMQK
jgi:hypothetical protein